MENTYPDGFKTIPHFTNYMASEDGRIYCKKGFYPAVSTFPTTKGHYLTCSVVSSDNGKRSDIVIHRLVALAYQYPGKRYILLDVNHKDGNKVNNCNPNLEWVTKGENLKHAYETGLRKDHRQFLVYDGDSGPKVFKSTKDIADHIGVKEGVVLGYLPRQQLTERRLHDRWKILLDGDHTPVMNRDSQRVSLVCHNFITGDREVAWSSFEASMIVGGSFATMLYLAKGNQKEVTGLWNGWGVWSRLHTPDMTGVTEDMISKSITKAKRSAELFLNKFSSV